VYGIYRAVLSRMNSNKNGKTFYYRFNLETDLNFGKKFFNFIEDGASHGDDLVS
jgi:hypothetical protein